LYSQSTIEIPDSVKGYTVQFILVFLIIFSCGKKYASQMIPEYFTLNLLPLHVLMPSDELILMPIHSLVYTA